jgi:hypothetical protein
VRSHHHLIFTLAVLCAASRSAAADPPAHPPRLHGPPVVSEAADLLARHLAASPGDRTLRLARARALSAAGRTREALEEYARLLDRAPGPLAARLEYADLLARDPDLRFAAEAEYEAVRSALPPPAPPGPRREPLAAASSVGGGKGPAGARATRTAAGLEGRAALAPGTEGALRAGWETLTGTGAARAEGVLAGARGSFTLGGPGALALEATLLWRGARRAGPLEGEAVLRGRLGGAALAASLVRRAREDSYRAEAGERLAGGRLAGAAADHLLALTAEGARGPLRLTGRAEAGLVRAAAGFRSLVARGGLRAFRPVATRGRLALSAGLDLRAEHHARDGALRPGGDPAAPGLDTPRLRLDLSPRAAIVHDAGTRGRLEVEAGPTAALLRGADGRALGAGAFLRAAASRRLGPVRLGLEAHGERTGKLRRAELAATAGAAF